MSNKNVKYGALLSYILIVLSSLYGIFITPFIIGQLGNAEYGVYKTITSFSSAFTVLDIGLGSTMMRYIAAFRADKKDDEIPNYIAMTFIQAAILIVVCSIVLSIGYFTLDSVYQKGLTASEIMQAKRIYIALAVEICIHIFSNIFSGIISGHNKFIFSNSLKIGSLITRVLLVIILLPILKNSLILVLINIFTALAFILIDYLYIRFKIKIKVKFKRWENSLFKESFKYTWLMFLTSIVARVNNSLDNVFVGAYLSSTAVAVYSIGLIFFSMYESLSTSISSVMLPTVIQTLSIDDDNYTKTKDIVVKSGRMQFILLAGALAGFIIIGKEFMEIWLGKGYDDAYIISIILMVPSLFELCINVCLSILRAKNILGFRTGVLVVSTIANLIITVVGTQIYGYYAAAVGTGFSFFAGSVVVMGIYYYKKLNINVIEIYGRIFKKIWLCLLMAGVVSWIVKGLISQIFMQVALTVIVFVLVYGITLYAYALDESEKKFLKLDKILKRKVKTND